MTLEIDTPPRLRQYVDGWLDEGAELTEHRDPADARIVRALVPRASAQDAERAIAVAHAAQPQWAAVPPFERAEVLRRAADLMADRLEELAHGITYEMGKPLTEARTEVQRAVEQTRYFASVVRQPEGAVMRLAGLDEQAYTLRVPVGVVAVITPWNFPFMIPNWKIASALVHGNTVVFKPAEGAPLSADGLLRCYLDAGLPPGALSLLYGSGAAMGPVLMESDDVDAVTFTGSTLVGRSLAAAAAARGKRVQAEMGGKNAVVVMPDADLDEAVASVVLAGFGTTGQRCTSSSRALVHREVAADFTERLVAATRALVVGPGTEPGVDIGPMASEDSMTNCLELLAQAIEQGVRVLIGGERAYGDGLENGWFVRPTVVQSPPRGLAFHEELFGPVVSVHSFTDLDEAIALNNAVRYGLSSAIYTRDLSAAHRFLREADTGMVHVNRPTVGAEAHLPFGGAKDSAYGTAELGASIDFFTRTRSAHIRWPR